MQSYDGCAVRAQRRCGGTLIADAVVARTLALMVVTLAATAMAACSGQTREGAPGTDATTGSSTTDEPGGTDPSTDGSLDSTGRGATGDSTGGSDPVQCDLFTNDCPTGTKCMAFGDEAGAAWVGTACMALADDPAEIGEACEVTDHRRSGVDNCAAQAICWFVDAQTLVGECVSMCTSDTVDPGCDLPCDTLCTIASELAPPLCLPGCDPLAQDCDPGRSCVAADTHFVCVVDESGDSGAMGDSCGSIAECDPGLFCLSSLAWPDCPGPGGCCAPACDLLDARSCAGTPRGVSCQPWYGRGSAPANNACTPFDRVGVCGS